MTVPAGHVSESSSSQVTSSKEVLMTTIKNAASSFWRTSAWLSPVFPGSPGTTGSNVVYKRLRERGYQVFAVNPNVDEVEGDRAYPDLGSIPGGVDAVVIGTGPEIADETMRECAELGIKQVWRHRGHAPAASPRLWPSMAVDAASR
jgi:hypothetical protein